MDPTASDSFAQDHQLDDDEELHFDEDDGSSLEGDVSGDHEDVDAVMQPGTSGRISLADGVRVFVVHRVEKAVAGYRPSFLFEGYLCDVWPSNTGSVLHRVVDSKLQLSLRYEPPSPKFTRQKPGCTSYRLKLIQEGQHFLYLLRGLPRVVRTDTAAQAVGWGLLNLAFTDPSELSTFVQLVRHVEVQEDKLWQHDTHRLWTEQTAAATPSSSLADKGGPAAQKGAATSTSGLGSSWSLLWRGCGTGTSNSSNAGSSSSSSLAPYVLPGLTLGAALLASSLLVWHGSSRRG